MKKLTAIVKIPKEEKPAFFLAKICNEFRKKDTIIYDALITRDNEVFILFENNLNDSKSWKKIITDVVEGDEYSVEVF